MPIRQAEIKVPIVWKFNTETSEQPGPVKEHKKEGMFNGLNMFYIPCRAIPPIPCTEVQKVSRGEEKKKKRERLSSTIIECSAEQIYTDC